MGKNRSELMAKLPKREVVESRNVDIRLSLTKPLLVYMLSFPLRCGP